MKPLTKRIIGWIGAVILVLIIYLSWSIVVYILVSVVLTIIISPVMRLLDKVHFREKKLPHALKALIGLLTLFIFFGSVLAIFIPPLVSEFKTISSINLEDINESLEHPLAQVDKWVNDHNLNLSEEFNSKQYLENEILDIIGINKVTQVFSNIVSGLGNLFIALFSIIFITFFFLRERHLATRMVYSVVPDRFMPRVQKILTKTRDSLSRYFIGILIQITLVATVVTTGLSIFGIKNALIIGVFAGIINIIPYLGPTLGAIFGVFIALTTNLDIDFSTNFLPFILKIVSVFALVQLMDNFIFQPFIFSNSVNAHPLEIFLVIMIAASIAGISGMIVAIPFYAFLRIVAREFLSEYKVIRVITRKIGD